MARRVFVSVLILTLVGAAAAFAKPAPELGSEENPIIWSFVPSGEMQRVSAGAESVAKLLREKTGLFIQTNVATEYVGVIEALAATPPKAHMASLATAAYIIAADRKVAQAALVAVRAGTPFYQGQIIAGANKNISKLADLKGKTFARPDPLSTSGWIIPMLTMKAAGINTDKDFKELVDAGSHDAVVAAVYNGTVDAGACYADARTRLQKDKPDVMEKVKVIQVSANIPNDGVQFHPSVPKEVRDKIVNGLLDIIKTDDGKKAVNTAYQWTELTLKDDSFYDPFRQVLQAAGFDPMELIKKK